MPKSKRRSTVSAEETAPAPVEAGGETVETVETVASVETIATAETVVVPPPVPDVVETAPTVAAPEPTAALETTPTG